MDDQRTGCILELERAESSVRNDSDLSATAQRMSRDRIGKKKLFDGGPQVFDAAVGRVA